MLRSHAGTSRVEHGVELQCDRSAVTNNFNFQTSSVGTSEIDGDVSESRRYAQVVRVAPTGNPADHLVVPD